MKISATNVEKILIIGGGTMGTRIALQAAISGFKVCIYDIDENVRLKANKLIDRIINMLNKSDPFIGREKENILSRICWTTDREMAGKDADFVSESVTENLELKKKVWTDFAPLLKKDCVLTTNTSYLLPSKFSKYTGNPGNFCAFHFHDVFTARVVDIMPHTTTNPGIIEFLYEIGIILNQIPVILKKETEGYIFNKLFGVNLLTAASIVATGNASVQDVDRSWMGNFNTKIGPFGMMDEVGIDTVWHVTKNMDIAGKEEILKFFKKYIDQGALGVKTGKGFYRYPFAEFKSTEFLAPGLISKKYKQ